ncbi:unnamed protein product, partial [Owenia fusiformis]
KTENETLTTAFTTAITNPVEINNTWTVASGTIVLECYFGQEGICSGVLLDGGRRRQGIYSLYGPLLNGRPVYIQEGEAAFLYYVIQNPQSRFWIISNNILSTIESTSGVVRVYDIALSADGITRTWQAYSQAGWVDDTKLEAACITNNTVPSETLYMGGVVTSSTPQTQRLGFYTIHGDYHNSRPVYIHESGKY